MRTAAASTTRSPTRLPRRLYEIVAEMRRRKDPDEIALLEDVHAGDRRRARLGRANIEAGHDRTGRVRRRLLRRCTRRSGTGRSSTATSPCRPAARARRPADPARARSRRDVHPRLLGGRAGLPQRLHEHARRRREADRRQQRLFDSVRMAMAAGRAELKAGATCQTVYDAVRGVFAAAGMAEHFTTTPATASASQHPEPPFIVRHSHRNAGRRRRGDARTRAVRGRRRRHPHRAQLPGHRDRLRAAEQPRPFAGLALAVQSHLPGMVL